MASRIETFDVTTPGNTLSTAPILTRLDFAMGVVQRIEIVVPPGPSGLMGFRLRHSGRTVIPYNTDNWIIADNEKMVWDVENYPVGAFWFIMTYNEDAYPHTIYLRFLVVETARSSNAAIPIIDIAPIPEANLEPEVLEEL